MLLYNSTIKHNSILYCTITGMQKADELYKIWTDGIYLSMKFCLHQVYEYLNIHIVRLLFGKGENIMNGI